MKVFEMKNELEKVSKVLPELRQKLDEAYGSETGKKSHLKLLWKQYADRHKDLRNSQEYRHLNLESLH